ncbi:hypothetical protein AKJ52_00590 [candidate division MSBL1 archaeon SCGC-AAA382C18]|uniref:HTH arsR-type domain-containing protein n=1 Tax=candidate division MSBL1 archaeon SCGC-AAA382C18 TaxID=1698281 RepID=A0A133VLH9_9EURY|nr:hypothetical protein AKJ52_00590 [candidate division MSBL1 archaeon SCGC-AAA382C18]
MPMEKKILEITSGTLEQFEDETLQNLEKIEKVGEEPDKIFFEDPTMFRKVLTEKRQELIQEIIERPPKSIRELADSLERGLREVHEDVHLLEKYKILSLNREGNRKKPRIPYDRIHIEINLPLDHKTRPTPKSTINKKG